MEYCTLQAVASGISDQGGGARFEVDITPKYVRNRYSVFKEYKVI